MIIQLDFIGMKGNGWHLIQRFYIKFKVVLKGYGCSRWDSNTIFFFWFHRNLKLTTILNIKRRFLTD